MRNKYVALILGIALVAPTFASDLGKEQRWRCLLYTSDAADE